MKLKTTEFYLGTAQRAANGEVLHYTHGDRPLSSLLSAKVAARLQFIYDQQRGLDPKEDEYVAVSVETIYHNPNE